MEAAHGQAQRFPCFDHVGGGGSLHICFAQTQAPPASIPDLAGIWVRPLLLFEPPASGPDPVAAS